MTATPCPLLVSFYTPTGDYPKHAARLLRECRALDVDAHIIELPDQGGYLENCRLKPVVLLAALQEFGRPMLWVDVDSSLVRRPTDIEHDVDFRGRAKPPGDPRSWHVDAMFFNATDASCELLELWVEHLTDHSDEYAFEAAWRSGRWHGSWGVLPTGYEDREGGTITFRRSRSPEKAAAHRALRGRPYAPR